MQWEPIYGNRLALAHDLALAQLQNDSSLIVKYTESIYPHPWITVPSAIAYTSIIAQISTSVLLALFVFLLH